MSKTKTKDKTLTRRQITRREKELKFQKTLTWIAIGIVSIIVIIVGYGIIAEIRVKQQPVARVYDDTITSQDYQARQAYERTMARMEIAQYNQYLQQYQNSPEMNEFLQQIELAKNNLESQLSPSLANIFGGQVLDSMIEEKLIRHEAATRNITVSQDEVDVHIESLLGYDREAMENITDTTGIPDYAEYYAAFKTNILDASGFSESDFRETAHAQLLKEQLMDVMSSETQTTTEQIEGTLLIVDSEEAGNEIHQRINEVGEDIEIIVEELNNSEDGRTAGFPITWSPAGYLASNLSPEVEEAAWNTPVGNASSPISDNDGQYYIFYVSGREERPLEGGLLTEARQQQYNQWLEEQKNEHTEYLDGWQKAVITSP